MSKVFLHYTFARQLWIICILPALFRYRILHSGSELHTWFVCTLRAEMIFKTKRDYMNHFMYGWMQDACVWVHQIESDIYADELNIYWNVKAESSMHRRWLQILTNLCSFDEWKRAMSLWNLAAPSCDGAWRMETFIGDNDMIFSAHNARLYVEHVISRWGSN